MLDRGHRIIVLKDTKKGKWIIMFKSSSLLPASSSAALLMGYRCWRSFCFSPLAHFHNLIIREEGFLSAPKNGGLGYLGYVLMGIKDTILCAKALLEDRHSRRFPGDFQATLMICMLKVNLIL